MLMALARRKPDVVPGLGECDDWGICDTTDTSGGRDWSSLWSVINQVTRTADNVIRANYGTPAANPGGTVRLSNGTIVTGGYAQQPNTGTVGGFSTQTLLIGGAAFVLLLVMMRKR